MTEQKKFTGLRTIDKPEQPNSNAILIKTIQQYMHLTTNALEKLDDGHYVSTKQVLVCKALEEIDLFEKTTLFDLQKAFE